MSKLFASLGALLLIFTAGPAWAVQVEGVVRDNGGFPVAEVDVDVIDQATGEEIDIPTGDTTDPDGTFTIDIPTGTYTFTFAPLLTSGLAGLEQADITVSGDMVLPDVTLPPGYRITMTTVDENREPLAQIDVGFENSSGADVFVANNDSNAQGVVDVVIPQAGVPYMIHLRDVGGRGFLTKTLIEFSPTGDTSLGQIIMGQAQQIAGRAVRFDNGLPVADVDIDVFSDSGLELEINGDLTDASGLFSLTGVPTGRYLIVFRPPSATGLDRREFRKVWVKEPLDFGDVVLGQLRTVSGRVLDSGGSPVVDADLNFTDEQYGFEIELNNDNSGTDGTFATEASDGTYTIAVRPPDGLGLAPKTIFGVAVAGDINVGDIMLGSALTLSGTVTDYDGAAVNDVDLDVIDPSAGREIFTADDHSNAAGAYSTIVESGAWTLVFNPPATRPDLQPVMFESVSIMGDHVLNVQLPRLNAVDAASWLVYQ